VFIALQCPERALLLNVQSEHLLVDVLDEQGQPCAEGKIGQVVVTDHLHNFAMPLIRMRCATGPRLVPSCSCGRGLPTLRSGCGAGTRNYWP
jgi:phenylacetate-CoA ligase